MFFGHLALSKCRILRVATIPAALAFGRKSVLLTAACIALACPMLLAQTTPAPTASSSPTLTATASPAPAFDVATIKPNPSAEPTSWMGIRNTPDGIEGAFVTIPMLIQRAYGLRSADQVSGGPEWARNERFDIQAKMSETKMAEMQKLSPAETKARHEAMLQAFLAEGFRLKVHSETRRAPVFGLVR